MRVLEAGCGSASHLRFREGSILAGIDISAEQLSRNPLLHEKIRSDIQTHAFRDAEFDLVVCWDVLEHLSDPHAALRNLFSAVRKGGIVLLALPNIYSLKGIITKLTPFKVHEWFYKYIIGDKRGKGEFGQFPTYFRAVLAPGKLESFAKGHGFSVLYLAVYQGPVQTYLRGRSRLADLFFASLGAGSRLLTMNRCDLNLTDYVIVLKKN